MCARKALASGSGIMPIPDLSYPFFECSPHFPFLFPFLNCLLSLSLLFLVHRPGVGYPLSRDGSDEFALWLRASYQDQRQERENAFCFPGKKYADEMEGARVAEGESRAGRRKRRRFFSLVEEEEWRCARGVRGVFVRDQRQCSCVKAGCIISLKRVSVCV